jgi:uncharacterized protein YrrD
MSYLERATELIGRPVVTMDTADDVAEIKDVVFHVGRWDVVGFTLRGRGALGDPDRGQLALESITAIGHHAIMITSDGVIAQHIGSLDQALKEPREVLGDEVLTDGGKRIGKVIDLVLQLEPSRVDVAGYEVETEDGKKVLVPIPETFGVSGDTLVVPAIVEQYITHDLTGFGGAVERFRAHLRDAEGGQRPSNGVQDPGSGSDAMRNGAPPPPDDAPGPRSPAPGGPA